MGASTCDRCSQTQATAVKHLGASMLVPVEQRLAVDQGGIDWGAVGGWLREYRAPFPLRILVRKACVFRTEIHVISLWILCGISDVTYFHMEYAWIFPM